MGRGGGREFRREIPPHSADERRKGNLIPVSRSEVYTRKGLRVGGLWFSLRVLRLLTDLRSYAWHSPPRAGRSQTFCSPFRGLIALTRSYYIIPTLLIFINLISLEVAFTSPPYCFPKQRRRTRVRSRPTWQTRRCTDREKSTALFVFFRWYRAVDAPHDDHRKLEFGVTRVHGAGMRVYASDGMYARCADRSGAEQSRAHASSVELRTATHPERILCDQLSR